MDFLTQNWIYLVGFGGQGLFGVRILVQWFYSEREGKPVSPVLYWQVSLVASFIVLTYGVLRKDPIIILGQILSYYIYIRNLQLKKSWTTIYSPIRYFLLILPMVFLAMVLYSVSNLMGELYENVQPMKPIFIIGAVGQLMLNLRFIYQWYYSEQRKVSILPLGFWVISLSASVLVLIYGLNRRDPVLISSQGLGMIAYVRNIWFYWRKGSLAAERA
ncbi:MAG: lipid-A-disaccharide synthase N-terminal domain-containing protein [Chryseolinea sp.]